MSMMNCLIRDVPDMYYRGQIREICWAVTDVFVIQKLSADVGDVRSGIVLLENGVDLANEGPYEAEYVTRH